MPQERYAESAACDAVVRAGAVSAPHCCRNDVPLSSASSPQAPRFTRLTSGTRIAPSHRHDENDSPATLVAADHARGERPSNRRDGEKPCRATNPARARRCPDQSDRRPCDVRGRQRTERRDRHSLCDRRPDPPHGSHPCRGVCRARHHGLRPQRGCDHAANCAATAPASGQSAPTEEVLRGQAPVLTPANQFEAARTSYLPTAPAARTCSSPARRRGRQFPGT
jgi:hypothetical protein